LFSTAPRRTWQGDHEVNGNCAMPEGFGVRTEFSRKVLLSHKGKQDSDIAWLKRQWRGKWTSA
jgi:hypothetical protein